MTSFHHTLSMAKKTSIAFFAILLFVFPSAANSQEILFSAPGGFYNDVFYLSLSCSIDGCTIHYTTNGNTPTPSDFIYTHPLRLDKTLYSKSDIYTIRNCPEAYWYQPQSVQHCIVIRAAAFNDVGECVSKVATNSYFISALGCDTHNLPVVSLCVDSSGLFDYEYGILIPGIHYDTTTENPDWTGNYYQSGIEWERKCNVEFYELNNAGINQQAGLRTHGGNGRRLQQKCLKIFARKEYGNKRFKHRFFETIKCENFKHLVFKPFASSWNGSGVNNYICGQIASKTNVDALASRPALLFLDGEYWGIYYLQEKPDEHYLESHYDVNVDRVNIINNWSGNCENGSNDSFLALLTWAESNDLTSDDNYEYIVSQIDISSFIDYQIFEIFTANLDWPANNMRCWQEDNGLWRWIFYDGDACLFKSASDFDALANATYTGDDFYPSNEKATLLFVKLLQNPRFKADFLTRFNQLLTTTFSYHITKEIYDEAYSTIASEIPSQIQRFNNPSSTCEWKKKMRRVDKFLSKRVGELYHALPQFHSLSNDNITISQLYPAPAQCEIHVNIEAKASTLSFIQIFDISGHPIVSLPHVFEKGENEITVATPDTPGIYILKTGNVSKKFIVTD